MMNLFNVSSKSEDEYKNTMGQNANLIDSADQKRQAVKQANGEGSTPKEEGFSLKDAAKTALFTPVFSKENVEDMGEKIVDFQQENPVIFEGLVAGGSVAFPAAAPAIQTGAMAVRGAGTMREVGDMVGGESEGMTESDSESVKEGGRQMLESDESFVNINHEYKETEGGSLVDRIRNMGAKRKNDEIEIERNKQQG